MNKPVAKVYISACSRRNPEWDMFTSLNAAIQFAALNGKIFSAIMPRVGGTLICRERQRAFREFLKSDFDYLLTLDDDVALPQDSIIKLVHANRDIIGGNYRLKDYKAGRIANRLKRPSLWSMILKSGIVSEAIYVSSGCMLISRRAAEQIRDAYDESLWYTENISNERTWAVYQPFIHTYSNGVREYLSEDWAFCLRASNIGIKLYVHGGVKCGHWGLHKFDFYYPKNFIDKVSENYDQSRNYGMIEKDEIDQEVIEEQTI